MDLKNNGNNKKIKVLFVVAENYPYASAGGLGMAIFSLAQALKKIGVDIRIFMPKYGLIDEAKYSMDVILKNLKVPTGEQSDEKKFLICNIKKAVTEKNIPVYFLENREYYEKRSNIYGYSDDPVRFALLSKGALEFLRQGDWIPDIINCADWHTGILADYLKNDYKDEPKFSKIKTNFSIHNIYHQGVFDHKFVSETDFDDGKSPIASFFSEALPKQNFLKRGIIYSDAVNTVSETYSKEIMTPEYGEKLDNLLKELRTKVSGILNGLDYQELNPSEDKSLFSNYSYSTIKKREFNKEALQKEFNLDVDPNIPLLGFVGRMDEQKGIDLLFPILETMVKELGIQFIAVGGGDTKYRTFFEEITNKYPTKVGCHSMHDVKLARHIFAGCDIFLMPSKFEPCGITQMEAMRYGAVPVVRKTGGLADTVKDFNPLDDSGSGFVFDKFSSCAFSMAIARAVETFKYKKVWDKLKKQVMKLDFSWDRSAKKYLELYQRISFSEKI
jgi:starch synthase